PAQGAVPRAATASVLPNGEPASLPPAAEDGRAREQSDGTGGRTGRGADEAASPARAGALRAAAPAPRDASTRPTGTTPTRGAGTPAAGGVRGGTAAGRGGRRARLRAERTHSS